MTDNEKNKLKEYQRNYQASKYYYFVENKIERENIKM